ncbi:hydroxyisourate hydrolase [Paenibacillus sp. HWE-109]|uniref:hydroxyisourate hydrolase n=1 Tax=Paenibacillus sp. HWE-109 TaxID=1306526 RepID=UPI001EDE5CCD|nr:hydroxyisourate hydrolase [Paenibacillus sp. HWE-109]UKS26542.1 hydroxyisourate hydrolase [Paenibacillus sp. HWE-109]
MSRGITTHVLDISSGRPAKDVHIALFRIQDGKSELLSSGATNSDGRLEGPLLSGEGYQAGVYELVFHIGDYFRGTGISLPEPAFLDQVPVRFGISATDVHYHVPLLVAPWGYNTYKGS